MNKQRKLISLFAGVLIVLIAGDVFAQEKIRTVTESELKDWFNTRKETYKLEQQFRANADQYESVVDAFFEARDKHLVENGWEVQNFKDMEEAIYNTMSGIREQEDINEEKEEMKEQIDFIKNNEYMTEEQKEEGIKTMYMIFEQRQKMVDATKHNWAVIKPYRKQLEQLDDWMANNAEEPADL